MATDVSSETGAAQLALIAHFDGDPRDLADRFGVAASQYSRLDAPPPASSLVMRNKEGIAVVLVWPEGSGIRPFQSFLRASLDELGLPHPRVEHFRVDATMGDGLYGSEQKRDGSHR